MTKAQILPVLAAVLAAAACGGDTAGVDSTASVRFFNATTGMPGEGGFTTDDQFAAGSALAYGESSPTCSAVEAGTVSIGFGAANGAGTGLSGSALATLNGQTITAGGNYTVVATGSAASPQLYLIDNSFTGSPGAAHAAVRFVNLAPGPNPVPYTVFVFQGGLPPSGTLLAGGGLLVGTPSVFESVTSGTKKFTAIVGHELATQTEAEFTLPGGSVSTIAIISQLTSAALQLVDLPRCPA